jgi:TonB family protein
MPAIFRSSFPAFLFLLASMSLAQTPPAAEGPPYRVGGNVLRPEKISGAAPTYTEKARKAGVTGTVVLDAVIDEKGNVTDIKVLQGLMSGLDESTIKAVKKWKFRPATLDGRPVSVYYTLTVSYTMETDLTYGPLLSKLMAENPDLDDLVRGKRYADALALLEGWPAVPGTRLARAYVLSAMRRMDEAWEEAQAYDGPEPSEVFNQVAFSALNAAVGTLDVEARSHFIEVGLQAATRAMAAKVDDTMAMMTKSQLLREKARLTTGPEHEALLSEARELAKRAGMDL